LEDTLLGFRHWQVFQQELEFRILSGNLEIWARKTRLQALVEEGFGLILTKAHVWIETRRAGFSGSLSDKNAGWNPQPQDVELEEGYGRYHSCGIYIYISSKFTYKVAYIS
jgi:hypothetical protein